MKKNIFLLSTVLATSLLAANPSKTYAMDYRGPAHTGSYTLVAGDTEKDAARTMIDKMGQKAISFLSSDKLSQSAKEKEFEKLLNSNFDMNTIGKFALGRNWKSASASQQKEYLKLFNDLIVTVYSARFNEYEGQSFEVESARDTGKKDVTVTTYIVPDNGSKVKVDWRVRNRNGQYKVVDVIVEGVSMTLTQRSDFSSVIQRGGGDMDVLLEHLRK